eukprot:3573588-Prymnesium_polylepis.1
MIQSIAAHQPCPRKREGCEQLPSGSIRPGMEFTRLWSFAEPIRAYPHGADEGFGPKIEIEITRQRRTRMWSNRPGGRVGGSWDPRAEWAACWRRWRGGR